VSKKGKGGCLAEAPVQLVIIREWEALKKKKKQLKERSNKAKGSSSSENSGRKSL
jgi:hypothetical protein